jgi:hypothetical protein
MVNYKIDESNIVILVDKSKKVALDGWKQTETNIVCGMLDNGDDTFSIPEIVKTADEISREKEAQIASEISTLKIGYCPTDKDGTFLVKFGSEIDDDTLDDDTLYNVDGETPTAIHESEDNVYLCSKSGIENIITKTKSIESSFIWYEDWGSFTSSVTELDIVLARALLEQQNIRDTIMQGE